MKQGLIIAIGLIIIFISVMSDSGTVLMLGCFVGLGVIFYGLATPRSGRSRYNYDNNYDYSSDDNDDNDDYDDGGGSDE